MLWKNVKYVSVRSDQSCLTVVFRVRRDEFEEVEPRLYSLHCTDPLFQVSWCSFNKFDREKWFSLLQMILTASNDLCSVSNHSVTLQEHHSDRHWKLSVACFVLSLYRNWSHHSDRHWQQSVACFVLALAFSFIHSTNSSWSFFSTKYWPSTTNAWNDKTS